MSRKAKYSKELKLEIIKRYLKGESATALANEYDIVGSNGTTRIREWVHKYESLGESVFDESKTNKAYSKELKNKVIQAYLNGEDSLDGLANKYNITSHSIVICWINKYKWYRN